MQKLNHCSPACKRFLGDGDEGPQAEREAEAHVFEENAREDVTDILDDVFGRGGPCSAPDVYCDVEGVGPGGVAGCRVCGLLATTSDDERTTEEE